MNLRAAADVIAGFDGSAVGYRTPTTNNSTGARGYQREDFDVALDDLVIHADRPAGAATLFLVSRTGFVANPGGGFGNLCLGGQVGRFNAQVTFVDAGGRASLGVPLRRCPRARPAWLLSRARPGASRPGTRTCSSVRRSNLTDGLSITFD